MATYEYECPHHKIIEVQQSMSDPPLEECPKCKEEGLEPQKVKRLISVSSFALLGGGWAKEGYK